MTIQYRTVNRRSETELGFIAEQDSKIPLLYDPEYVWSDSSIAARTRFYKDHVHDDDFFEVALDADDLIAFHIVKKIPYPPDLSAGAIITLWVAPKYRGQRIAKTLKDRAEAWARKQDFAFLQTDVHSTNSKMISINKKAGYNVIQYTMRKPL